MENQSLASVREMLRQVLEEAGTPLTTPEIVQRVGERWPAVTANPIWEDNYKKYVTLFCRVAGPNPGGRGNLWVWREPEAAAPEAPAAQESLTEDLHSMNISGPAVPAASEAHPTASSGLDLLGGGLDGLLGGDVGGAAAAPVSQTTTGLLGDTFGFAAPPAMYVFPKVNWLPAEKGKGLDIWGTFSRKNGQISMDFTFTNKAMQAMCNFEVHIFQNGFGLTPAAPLPAAAPVPPGTSHECSLTLVTTGVVKHVEPLTNLQVKVENNIDILTFECIVPMNVYFCEDGQMDKRVFLNTWKEIPAQNEVQYVLNDVKCNPGNVVAKMQQNNVFTIDERNVEGQDMLYQSLKLTNGTWVLIELKIQPGNPNITLQLSLKTRALDVAAGVFQAYDQIIHS